MAWNWGVPGVRVRVPNTRNPIPALPMNWDSLAFDPLSAYDLRRHLGVPSQEGVYMDAQRNFVSGELAHLAAGASDDGRHLIDPNTFFAEFDRLRSVTPIGNPGV